MIRALPALLLAALVACTSDGAAGDGTTNGAADVAELARAPLALGGWTVQRMEGEAAALFGPPAGEASFLIRCDARTREVQLVRAGPAPRPGTAPSLRLVTEGGSITLAARTPPGSPAQVEATVPADAPAVAALRSEADGRVGVAVDGREPMVMPGDPAIADVLRGCDAR